MSRSPVILIADDDSTMRMLISMSLTKAGFAVREACNGRDAVRCFQDEVVDLVMMDVRMPEMDGFEACRAIRLLNIRSVPIVMVTGLEDQDAITKAFAAGADEFISKPINWVLLGHQVRFWVRSALAMSAERQALLRERALFQALPDAVIRLSPTFKVLALHVGVIGERLLLGARCISLPLEDCLPVELFRQLQTCLFSTSSSSKEIQRCQVTVTMQSSILYLESQIVAAEDGELTLILRDISQKVLAEQAVHRLRHFDEVTGLPNLYGFECFTEEWLQHNLQDNFAVLYISLNNFSRVVDTLGSAAAEQVLFNIARLFGECHPFGTVATPTESGLLAHASTSNFIVVIRGDAEQAHTLARTMLRTLNSADVTHSDFRLNASVGIALAPSNGQDVRHLLACAQLALRQVKHSGDASIHFYSEELNIAVREQANIELALNGAIERGEFRLAIQPLVDAQTGLAHGGEVLLRWQHPILGWIPPDRFIAIAEAVGLITPITYWVVEQACCLLAELRRDLIPDLWLAINISPQCFLPQHDFVQQITQRIAQHGLPTNAIELEITEGVLLKDGAYTLSVLSALKAEGLRISIDDFGTGYSSLSYLSRFPLDKLKIDRSFVIGLADDNKMRKLAQSIIMMAHGLGLTVVAEGVETPEQRDFLLEMGCDIFQGYGFAKPMLIETYTRWLQKINTQISTTTSHLAMPMGGNF